MKNSRTRAARVASTFDGGGDRDVVLKNMERIFSLICLNFVQNKERRWNIQFLLQPLSGMYI
jgi:hypothetical protein